MANRTRRCTVGTAIAYGVGRSPLMLAAEARDLDELVRRALRARARQRDAPDDRRLARRRPRARPPCGWRSWCRCCASSGACTRGRSTTRAASTACTFTADRRAAAAAARAIPIYTAGVNPRMVEAAGPGRRRPARPRAVHPGYLADVVAAGDRARGRAGRPRPRTCASRRCVITRRSTRTPSGRGARPPRRSPSTPRRRPTPPLLERTRLRRRGRGDPRRPSRAATTTRWSRPCPERMVDALAVAGTPAECAPGCRRYEGLSTTRSSTRRASGSRRSACATALGLIEAVRA